LLPVFSSPTDISFRVIGYDENNGRLFSRNKDDEPPMPTRNGVFETDISGITINVGDISDTPRDVKPLTNNIWTQAFIDENEEGIDWYSIDVTAGNTYYLWWNDSESGDGTKSLDIDVHAYDDSETIIPLQDNDNAWDTPVSFTASSSSTVYIRVRALYGAVQTGTYAIIYNTDGFIVGSKSHPIPIAGVTKWMHDRIPSSSSGSTIWYSFNVAQYQEYSIWWNDSGRDGGDGSKTLDVKVDAYYSDQNGNLTTIFAEADSAWKTPKTFNVGSSQMTTVKVKVSPFFRTDENDGTFAIAYTLWNKTSIPKLSAEDNPIPLTIRVWASGVNTSSEQDVWYSFEVAEGTTYYVWWNDRGEGDASRTSNVNVSASYSDGSSIFTSIDRGWATPQSFTATSTGTVKLRVRLDWGAVGPGTFAVVYSTSSARP